MKRVVILSYTERGGQLNSRLARLLREGGDVAVSCRFGQDFSSTAQLLEEEWRCAGAFLFVGAVGIAVRHIAPLLEDKLHDPAVLAADEDGRFLIPVLSGHVGGGVALARELADKIGAQAVITTATDVRGRFAVDSFAAANHLCVPDPAAVREISAAVLQDTAIELRTDIPIAGEVPEGLTVRREGASADIAVGYPDGRAACVLAHRPYIVGVGCKKGKSGAELSAFLAEVCGQNGIDARRVAAVASIDKKREEKGIWELARGLGVPYGVFAAEELAQIEEEVSPSAFVESAVGVDNVCERSALCLAKRWAAGGVYKLVAKKQVRDGMTLAVAAFRPTAYRFLTSEEKKLC